MAGGLFGKEFALNPKCIVFSIIIMSLFLCKPTFRVTPRVGDFYFFPHYLMHAVYPFSQSDDERRSVSFNATVDQSLFNE